MMISQAVLLIAFSGILNTTGTSYFSSERIFNDVKTIEGEYRMPIIEPSPGSQYHILSIKPDPTKDFKIHVIDPDARMGKIGKFKKGK